MSAILGIDSFHPIAFYGRVIDQHGKPVAGAKVRGNVERVRWWMDQKWDEHFTTTNSSGDFKFTFLHGQSLVVTPTKGGYESKSGRSFEYSGLASANERHHPDRASPVVFTMWKQQGAERLKHVRMDWIAVPVNGTPTSFDLITGKKLPSGGDVILKIERHPEHIDRGTRFNWKATLEVPDGGIVEIHDVYPNEAPAEGYEAQFTIEMPTNSKGWESSVTRSFYVKARDGKLYARITLRITADYEPPPTSVAMEAWVNPSGSRNLEYDPSKEVMAR